jgi:hypothetical protein
VIDPRSIPWALIYGAPSRIAAAKVAIADPRTRREVIAGLRGLDERLGGELIPPAYESKVPAVTPPRRSIFLLAATGSDSGVLGHVAGYQPRGRAQQSSEGSAAILGASEVIESVLETMSPLAPEAARPLIEHVMPVSASGDSHALAVGLVAVLTTFSVDAAPSVAATGGWDPLANRFRPVPPETLRAKLAVAEAWGLSRVLVIEGQEGIGATPLEVIEVPADPGALPLAAIQFAAGDVGKASVRRALGLYDIQVARQHTTSIEAIFAATAPFIDEAACSDPVLRQISADMRSRACLHRGESVEAAKWLDIALHLRGESYLPDGLTGDYLLYQQPAHHSVTRIDQGLLEDDPIHARVDSLIEDLTGRWCTQHQALCRIFLRHTRARRGEYIARLKGDSNRLAAAIEDMFAEEALWEPLIGIYAQRSLRMGDTTVRRVHNQLIDLAVTEASFADPEGFSSLDFRPPVTPLVERLASFVWAKGLESIPSDASPYDVVGVLKWRWLQGEAVPSGSEEFVNPSRGFPHTLAGEYLLRLGSSSPRAALEATFDSPPPEGSIIRVLAARTAALLGVPLERVAPPSEGHPLRVLFDDLLDTPSTIVARCPY